MIAAHLFILKAKSCKGFLYYSTHFKADSGNPLCVGLTRSLPDVPQYIIGQSEEEASKEDGNGLPQRRSPKPANATGEDFLSRLTRNANLVANGVAKNIRKVGNQIKESLDDILYPYRRPPK